MKFLKWLLIIMLILIALVLIIPLFMPATVKIIVNKEIALSPAQVFYNAASYTDRNKWDPWLETEPDAEWMVESEPGYVGSVYTWNGKKIGAGKMMVDSVVFGKYIASKIWFGDNPESSLVEWNLEQTDSGTMVTWSFTSGGKYPIERLMINLVKGSMQSSFEIGMESLKTYLEANPPVLCKLGEIERGKIAPMFALVASVKGIIEEIGAKMEELYGILWGEIESQGLQMAGAAFSHYISFDEETGIVEYLVGLPVVSKGKDAGPVKFVNYREMEVIQAIHYGPYDDVDNSYDKIMEYIATNQYRITGEVFEFYLNDPTQEPDITKYQTLIAFPLK